MLSEKADQSSVDFLDDKREQSDQKSNQILLRIQFFYKPNFTFYLKNDSLKDTDGPQFTSYRGHSTIQLSFPFISYA